MIEKLVEGCFFCVFEWLGFWNGLMVGWNIVFVEIFGDFFVLVKMVFDFLGLLY